MRGVFARTFIPVVWLQFNAILRLGVNFREAKMMNSIKCISSRPALVAFLYAATGLTLGVIGGQGLAQVAPPTEHKGLGVETLGVICDL